MATAPRALLGQRLAALLPGDLEKVFFTNGGAEANENAIKLARLATGRHKIAVRYRSYHGATAGAMTLTGDPRRWANEPGIPGVIRIPDTQPWGEPEPLPAAQVLAETERVLQYEGPHTIAAILIEPVVGTNGILIPPEGYLQGLRALCDRYGILLIADEVMSGFGRTGAWFAVDHWGVVPDLLTMAKGLTSSYVPLGAVAMRRSIAAYFEDHVFAGGLTYNSHPLACAAALATLGVYEADGLIARAAAMGARMREHHLALQAAHPCVGAVRNIGLFGVIELVRRRSPYEPLAPYNGTSPEMAVLARALRDAGLYTFVRWNAISTNPPLTISEDELAEGFAIIDRALTLVDQMLAG
jgi:taurine--2-oxoglutarate transaminase